LDTLSLSKRAILYIIIALHCLMQNAYTACYTLVVIQSSRSGVADPGGLGGWVDGCGE